jgi:GTP-binding protein EngB required for normal cell division
VNSVVARAPVAPLAATATSLSTLTATGEDRVTEVVSTDANGVSTIVVVGASHCGKSSVINALLGPPTLAPAGGAVARPVTSAYLLFRHGDSPAAYAYAPGYRGPRPLSLDELRDGDLAALVRGGPARPPRRVDVFHPAELLRKVSLVDTPGVGGFDQTYTKIALDVLDQGAGLLFVADSSTALQPAELDFLAQAERRRVPAVFALTKIDAHPEWPAVLSANQKLVHDHAPRLATAPWYALSTLPGHDAAPSVTVAPVAAPSVTVAEAAHGLAGLGVVALRRALTEPAPGEATVAGPAPGGVPPAGAPCASAPRVAATATDVRWLEVLDYEIRSRAVAIGQRLAVDLDTIHARCVPETSDESGCTRLAHVFDRELHALSIRATTTLEAAATTVMRSVFGEILESQPDEAALARVRRATHRAMESAEGGEPQRYRVLLVTATSGVAVTAGRGAVASLAAVPPRSLEDALLPPIGIGLSAGCYAAWRSCGADRVCRGWLQRAIQVLEGSLERECARRFDRLRDALVAVATDTIDHGVLLA